MLFPITQIMASALICIVGAGAGSFAEALWLFQFAGNSVDGGAQQERVVKATLAKALAKDGVIAYDEVRNIISAEAFDKVAGKDKLMKPEEIHSAVIDATPGSRSRLNPAITTHLDLLATSLDQLNPAHEESIAKLAAWIAENQAEQKPLHVIIVCTGNSRRSMLGSCMGNAAAAYYGFENLHFHSGGTAPSAFNSRTINTLRSIGFKIDATGEEAARGSVETANPICNVSWGEGLQSVEFSKHYGDARNPQSDFAAVMVCTDADEGCPIVKGAALRISMPFFDPKAYDDGALEAAKYAEERDNIARTMLSVLARARRIASNR
ncbi:MAG: hypothetical protein U0892_15490 [Pirellulales bacterium]